MRAIVHLDADAFFASVEQASDPRLRGQPIAVGGEKRGIIASASYEARKFGIYTPMPSIQARRLCPKLILLPGDFEKYELFSRLMFSYAYDFTPEVEIGSIDEGYFDLTGTRKPAVTIADTLRRTIRQALKLSVSEGIASNKLVSQIASKLKKPSAFEFVPGGSEALFLSPLANKWLPGIGPKAAVQLNAAGLARIGQIAQTPVDLLNLLVGSLAPQLRNFARGIDERPVVPARAPAKSYGEQETFGADTTDEEFIEATLRRMADKLMAKVRADGKSVRTLAVKVRYNDMDEEQASESLDEPTDLETAVYDKIAALLRKAWRRRVSLRLVSLRLSNVYDSRFGNGLALDACSRLEVAQQRLADTVDELREKFGRSVVLRGHDFLLRVRNGHGEEPSSETQPARRFRAPGLAGPRSVASFRPPIMGRDGSRHFLNRWFGTRPATKGPFTPANCRQSASAANRHTRIQSIPLNVHSYYSFLDSTLSIKAIVDLAKRHELPAIALTDKNNLHGAVEFALAAAQAGIKSILGAEVDWNGQRACLYVQNQTGYNNLCQILTKAGQASRLPRPQNFKLPIVNCQFEIAAGSMGTPGAAGAGETPALLCTEGLIAVSPSAALASSFPDRFYLEINSPEAWEKRPPALPCVASLPVHYELPSDQQKYDIVQSIRTLTLLRQQHPEKRLEGDYHFRSPAEMNRLFGVHPELLDHSREIAERCTFAFSLGKPQFPSYRPADGSTPGEFLRRLVLAGLQRRYPKDHARLKPQVEEELAIILEVGYEEYFLVMWDILQACRRRGIEWITRGSAADSLACYCLEISDVCPIRFDLYFRRFLNKDRMALNKLPDIDVDFPHDRKDDVIDLIFEKYGAAHAAVVGGFSTFQSRSAFAEIAKVLGVSEYQVRRLTERLPHFSRAGDLAETVASTLECRDLPLEQEPYATALRMACFLDGFPRYAKMHPCGLVLSRQPMHELTPCFVSAKGYPTTHFDMDSVEAIGLIKMDILAQGGLAVMRDVREMLGKSEIRKFKSETNLNEPNSKDQNSGATSAISEPNLEVTEECATCTRSANGPAFSLSPSQGERAGVRGPLNISDLGFRISNFPSTHGPFDDSEVWSLIANGSARAVHHIESPAMVSLCRMCNVRDIDTLIAIVSVIRPGAANESKKMEFARRYQGLSPVRYPHPSLAACLRSTYGLVVYEEHILQICEAFAGLPPGRADILRRALAKEHTELIEQIRVEFTNCARRQGRTEAEIAEVWELVAGFRGYAFCKAHSTAYGVEAYQSAWLKRYYPAEFMAAVLTNGKGFYQPLVYILECHRLGIPLLPPCVNEPGPEFKVGQASRLPQSRAGVSPAPAASGLAIEPAVISNRQLEIENLKFPGRGRRDACPTLKAIRIPVLQVKGLTTRTKETLLRERERSAFASLTDFFFRVQPLPEEMDILIRVGAFDTFGKNRTAQYWEFKSLCRSVTTAGQLWLLPPGNLDRLPSVPLAEPTRRERLRAEEELLGYTASGHPLELFSDIAWETYCPVNRLAAHVGQDVVTCGLVIEQRLFHQVTGEPMKFLTLADWTGMVETELFARTYKSYGLNTIRYRVLEITARAEPFENGRGFSLRVLRAGKPRTKRNSALEKRPGTRLASVALAKEGSTASHSAAS